MCLKLLSIRNALVLIMVCNALELVRDIPVDMSVSFFTLGFAFRVVRHHATCLDLFPID
jgi:hypothetical protein